MCVCLNEDATVPFPPAVHLTRCAKNPVNRPILVKRAGVNAHMAQRKRASQEQSAAKIRLISRSVPIANLIHKTACKIISRRFLLVSSNQAVIFFFSPPHPALLTVNETPLANAKAHINLLAFLCEREIRGSEKTRG